MCLPVAPLMLAATVMSAAGSVVQGVQANNQSKYEAGVAKNNAQLAREQRVEAEAASAKERKDYWRDVAKTKGNQVAAMAANGIDVGFGTAQRVQDDTVMLSREDADAMYSNQSNRRKGFEINAANYMAEAKAARARGKAALIGGMIQGATTLIGGAAQFKAKRAMYGG
jgi:hypothetical protein